MAGGSKKKCGSGYRCRLFLMQLHQKVKTTHSAKLAGYIYWLINIVFFLEFKRSLICTTKSINNKKKNLWLQHPNNIGVVGPIIMAGKGWHSYLVILLMKIVFVERPLALPGSAKNTFILKHNWLCKGLRLWTYLIKWLIQPLCPHF